jgi:glycerol-3-phosphate dehydrogenase
VLRAEVVHAAREEMVETLADVVLRRTDLGTAGHPGEAALRECAALAAAELGWDDARAARELEDARSAFPMAPAAATAA